jgi:alpha-1,2-mannosyltransferase
VYAVTFDARLRHNADSWAPMFAAWEHLRSGREDPVYEHLYAQGYKFQYPPPSLLICEALGRQSERQRYFVLNAIAWVLLWLNALLVGLIFVESSRQHAGSTGRGREAVLLVLGAAFTLLFYPVVRAMWLGQIQVAINTAVAGAILLAMRGRWGAAGALLGFVSIFKPQFGLVLLWGVIQKRWRLLLGMAAITLPAGAAGLWLYGWTVHVEYLRWLSFIAQRGESFHPNQSMNGLLHRLMANGNNQVWRTTYPDYNPLVHGGTVAATLLLAGFGLFWRRTGERCVQSLMIAILCFTMASPVAWEHHYGILPPILAWLLPALIRNPALGRWTVPAWMIAALIAGGLFRFTLHFAETPLSVVQSYVFFAAAAVLVLLARVRQGVEEPLPGRR